MISDKPIRVYIYTRVSTVIQVEGYSLEAQKTRLLKFAEANDFEVVREYEDAGRSGRSIENRPQFQQMISDMASGKDNISYILVFKLSRFGRNAADVLNTLQIMQDYGVNLICVEDGIDSSKDSGKLVISVLSAVAEIEKENIRVQTMEGRMQKAKDGKWNGGFAPYGYKLNKGMLEIEEKEAAAIRIIFNKYVHTDLGVSGIAKYLETQGIEKIPRQNGKSRFFSAAFIRTIIRNEVYCGKIAYNRRKIEKVKGTRNDYHQVRQKEYSVHPGLHQAIVSEELWNAAQKKADMQAKKYEHINKKKEVKVHLLSNIVKCPVCGAGMYSNVSIKKKADGTPYKNIYYYACKHRDKTRGDTCDFRKQVNEEKLDAAVIETIRELVSKPKFAELMQQKIFVQVDTTEIDAEIAYYRKQLTHNTGLKDRLLDEIDTLNWDDQHYKLRKDDLEKRLTKAYDNIKKSEEELFRVQNRKVTIEKEKITLNNIYSILINFEKLFETFSDSERRQFIELLIAEIQIYPDKQDNGQWLKSITFKLPIFSEELLEGLDKNRHVETCVLLSKLL